MTPIHLVPRLSASGAAVAAVVATITLMSGALAVQRERSAWPFIPTVTEGAAKAAMEADAGEHAGHGNGAASPSSRVAVDATAAQALDIRLEHVMRTPLLQTVRTVATIAPDESRISHVHTRVAGWVEQLDVNTTGESVRAGQPLARIFSQELLSSQTEYLAARRNTATAGITSAVVSGGRTRLAVLGMSEAEISAIEETGDPKRLVTVVAPRSGVVVNRGVSVGTSVDPSTTLLTIADLSTVWVLAEVPEASIPFIHVGTTAEIDFPASGRAPFKARVDFIYPMLSERTRTLRVRLSASNRDGALKPGLYGNAAFESTTGNVLTVSRDAVIDTGLTQHVFVAEGDQFAPRTVVVGAQLSDRVEIRSGLREHEQVVAAGVFLLDSESRLRATGGGTGHNHGGAAPADPHAGHRR